MASITVEAKIEVSAERAWATLRDVGAADRAFPGVLVACRLEGDVRTVTFANGAVVRERIVDIDEARRRIAYAVIEGRFSHHSASMQIIAEGPDRGRFVWVSDFLPDEAEPLVRGLIEQGTEAFRHAVESATQGVFVR
jgi:Polyketide cyclase / dehydrase and lipid transport